MVPEAERERWQSDLSSLSRLLLTRFEGKAETVRRLPLPQLPGRERLEVRFRDVR